MRLRVVFFTLLFPLVLPASVRAEGNQLQSLSQVKPSPPSAPLTSDRERAALHNSPDWELIAPHLPDPQTASAQSWS